jgi:hypothetical protein
VFFDFSREDIPQRHCYGADLRADRGAARARRIGRDGEGNRAKEGKVRETAPTEAVGYTIDGGQEAIMAILD